MEELNANRESGWHTPAQQAELQTMERRLESSEQENSRLTEIVNKLNEELEPLREQSRELEDLKSQYASGPEETAMELQRLAEQLQRQETKTEEAKDKIKS